MKGQFTNPLGSVFAAVALLFVVAETARGNVLYGIDGSANNLITINPATGAGTVVGPLSTPMFPVGIAFRGAKLYTYDNNANRLYELNPATGATVNTINLGPIPGGEGDIAFRNDGIGFLCTWAPSPLFRVDLTVPSATPLGLLTPTMDGLAFNGAGVLYGISQGNSPVGTNDPTGNAQLYTINQTTGVVTLVGSTGVGGCAGGGLAFDDQGNLFAALSLGPGFGFGTLYKINPTTGAATPIGPVGMNVVGIRFAIGPSPPPPPPSPPPGGGGSGGGGGGLGEGSFAGCDPPPSPAGEGSFGFGVSGLSLSPSARPKQAGPMLAGPYFALPGPAKTLSPANFAAAPPAGSHLYVLNVSGPVGGTAGSAPAGSAAAPLLGWTILAALALAGALRLRRKGSLDQ